jgi:hypothetical protein
MSFTLMAACILGIDVLLYALFQWAYPDRGGKPRRTASQARQRRLQHPQHSRLSLMPCCNSGTPFRGPCKPSPHFSAHALCVRTESSSAKLV